MNSIWMDGRWVGAHGIGRFAAELAARNGYQRLPLEGRPMAPADPLKLALALRRLDRRGVFFSPGYNAPLWARQPFVFTVHDLNHIDRSENSSWLKRLYYQFVLRGACRRAAVVLTVSEYSRTRIVDWAGIAAQRVVNVGNGVDASFRPEGDLHDAGGPYLLCVGNRKLHKNEERVVEAFAMSGLAGPLRLVFTGEPSPELERVIASHRLQARVVFAGRVPEASLPGLYRGATALLFPSLYEGFGLPVIEAFACGTPVVTSNTTSLPEVAADAALLVDPLSTPQIAEAITRVVSDPALRATLRERGLRRAADYGWPAVAERVRTVLDAVAAGLRPGTPAWPLTPNHRPPKT